MNRTKELSLRVFIVLMFVMFSLPIEAADKNKGPDAAKFSGIWECELSEAAGKQYLKIIKEESGRFKFLIGFKYDRGMSWTNPEVKGADGIYLKLSKGKLKGEFVSPNFGATHSQEWTYKITLDLKSNNKLLYSVETGGGVETLEATKISE
ncbi:MAG: hypothetical protein WAV82_05395 [Methylobacter sp.]